jgi:hypothetical protein
MGQMFRFEGSSPTFLPPCSHDRLELHGPQEGVVALIRMTASRDTWSYILKVERWNEELDGRRRR